VRIRFQCEGGFARFPGLSKPITVDTASLPAADAAELKSLVDRARFFKQPAQISRAGAGAADYRTYTICVEDTGRSHTIQATDPVADPSLQALIEALRVRQRRPE
jgi:hypothetical protein